MVQSPVITTGLWPIAINKGEIISSLFICMAQSTVVITVLWPIAMNKEEINSSLFMYGPKPCDHYGPLAHCHE